MIPNKQSGRHINPGRTIGGIADRLGHYLAHGGPGTDASNFGEMCERLSTTGYDTTRCSDCRGIGCRRCNDVGFIHTKLRQSRVQCARCAGAGCVACMQKGHRWRQAPDSMFNTVRCSRCKGCGEVPNEEVEDACPSCGGEMSHVPVTVRETGCSKKGKPPKREPVKESDSTPAVDRLRPRHVEQFRADTGDGPEDTREAPPEAFIYSAEHEEQTRAYGEMSRLMLHIRESDPLAAAALEAYYGEDGDRWAPTRWGRVFALWQFTTAGKQIAIDGQRRSANGHGFELRALDQIASERNAEDCAQTPSIHRRALVGEADKAARLLLTRANRALAEAGHR